MDRQRHIYWKSVDLFSNDRLSDVSLLLMVENRTVMKGIAMFLGDLSHSQTKSSSSSTLCMLTGEIRSAQLLDVHGISNSSASSVYDTLLMLLTFWGS